MKTIKPYYGVSPMSNSSGPKGSSTNPYTEEEYEEMLDAGTWQGGYVEGKGYCMKQPVVTASYPDSGSSSSSDDSWPSDDSEDKNDHNPTTPPTPPTGGGGGGGSSHGGGGGGTSGGTNNPTNKPNPYPQTTKTVKDVALLYGLVEGMGGQATFVYEYTVNISGYRMSISASVYPSNFSGKEFWATAIVNSNETGTQYYKLNYSDQGYITAPQWIAIGDCTFDLPQSGNVTVKLVIGFNYDTGTGHSSASTKISVYPF